jgi:protein-S-isoprenylcysteine O-methyltransferase Ste14
MKYLLIFHTVKGMERIIAFGILSLSIIIISWRTIFNIKSHGFYRFLSWECIIWLSVTNYQYWFHDPFSIKQIFSWLFLFISGYLVISGVILIKKIGKPVKNRDDKTLYQFEKTSELIDKGIFKYIRHPLYSSLLFLTWGIFLKNTAYLLLFAALLSTVFLYLTAIFEEKECMKFFGGKYYEYMKRSKKFIPFII